jgi:hypothetical protein
VAHDADASRPEEAASEPSSRSGERPAVLLLLAAAIVGLGTLVESRLDLCLRDEGFLWDGVNKTRAGQVPVRDFWSYDPGRYYWCAALAPLLGDGIVGLRWSVAVFQFLGLACGLAAASRVLRSRWALLLLGIVLFIWMIPRWKGFEHGISLMAVYAAVRLVEERSRWWHFLCGVLVGLAGFLGRNHGLYGVLAFGGLILLLQWKTGFASLRRSLSAWMAGIALGALPMAAMLLFVPGFFEANVAWLRLMWEHGTTLPCPVPWPWVALSAAGPWQQRLVSMSTGFGFIFALLTCGLLLLAALRTRAVALPGRALVLAAAFVGTVYLHHAFSRADILHLGQSILPVVLGGLALVLGWQRPWARIRFSAVALVLVLTLPAALSRHPSTGWLVGLCQGRPWVGCQVQHDRLLLPPRVASYLREVEEVIAPYRAENGAVFVAPFFPTLYPVLGQLCPVSNSYPLLPASESMQQRMIRDLGSGNVQVAIISEMMLDQDPRRTFRSTHPLVWEYVQKHFRVVGRLREAAVMVPRVHAVDSVP